MVLKAKGYVEKSAGGLVWSQGSNPKRIVIVHRKRYGGEWTLPKGHLKTEKRDNEELIIEDWQEAALREVAEETRCNVKDLKIEDTAGSLCYNVNGTPKFVLFFNMICLGDYDFNRKISDDEEVDEVRLVNLFEALSLLKYPKERVLIQGTDPLASMKPARLLGLRKAFKSSSHRRLHESIGAYELELKNKIKRAVSEKQNEEEKQKVIHSSEAALEALECSKKALALGEIEAGWRYLFQADLEQIALESNSSSLRKMASATLNEAERKLSSWRLKTVQGYLGEKGNLRDNIMVEDVYRSQKILKEHFTNRYIKLHTAQFQLGILSLIALALIFPAILITPSISGQVSLNSLGLIISVVLFGALGGCFSGIFSISRDAGEGKIPDKILSSWMTIARPVIGIMAALAISGFLLSGIIQVGTLTVPLILAISFTVGFSERLLIRAMDLKAS